MEPLNQVAKKKAIINFIGIYVLSLLAVLLLSFFLFSAPLNIYKDQAKEYSNFKEQHHTLLNKTDSITEQLKDLIKMGEINTGYSNPGLDSIAMPTHDKISRFVHDLKQDSTSKAFQLFERDISNYLVAYNAVLLFQKKNRINHSFTDPNSPPVTIKHPDTIKISNEEQAIKFQEAVQLNIDYRKEIKKLRDSLNKKTDLAGKPGVKDGSTTPESERQGYLNQISSKDATITSLNRKVAELDRKLVNINKPLSDAEKADAIFKTVDQIITEGLSTGDHTKGVCSKVKKILVEIKNDYTDKDLYDKMVVKVRKFCEIR